MVKVALLGFMGAGKTSVGKTLARLTGANFYDTDEIIEQRFGAIPLIFQTKGEAFFRKIEEETVKEVVNLSEDAVIALGGGAVLSEKTRHIILSHTIPIYVKCNLQTAFSRVKESDRPLAKTFKEFSELFKKRKTIYENFPFSIQNDVSSTEETALSINEFLKKVEFSRVHKVSIEPLPINKMQELNKGFFITDQNVYKIYRTIFDGKNGFVMPAGESAKTLDSVKAIYNTFLQNGITRDSNVSYVGGGVVGDVAGFAASTFLRGIPMYAFPTTLLSMVDSAIGGKNGVNLPQGKNLVGTFYFPEQTFINPMFLGSLPDEELLNGTGELFKYALLSENGIFELLEKNGRNIFKSVEVKEIIKKSVEEKLQFISSDIFDKKGKRAFLNLGHTVGHAVERLSTFSVKHGEAVAVGIIVSAFFSMRKGMLPEKDFERICRLFNDLGFSLKGTKFDKKAFLKTVSYDKKRIGTKINWILPVKYNKCRALEISIEDIENAYMEVKNANPCN